jgi:hypothetical protein
MGRSGVLPDDVVAELTKTQDQVIIDAEVVEDE